MATGERRFRGGAEGRRAQRIRRRGTRLGPAFADCRRSRFRAHAAGRGGLLLRSFSRLQAVPVGLDPENVLTMDLSLPPYKYPDDLADTGRWAELLCRRCQPT